MLSTRGRSYLCLDQMFSSAGRSCLWLSKCHPLQGGHAKNCLNHIQYKEVPYLEVSKCYPVEGGHIYVLLRCIVVQGGRVYGCLNVIHCKEVMLRTV